MIPRMLHNKRGFALLFVFFFVILVAGIVVAYLELTSQGTSDFTAMRTDAQAFYAAEAAQVRAVQYLQNNWGGIWNTIQPNNGNLGTFTITVPLAGPPPPPLPAPLESSALISNFQFIVDNWNLARSGNQAPFGGTTAVASSTQVGTAADRAIDGATGNGRLWRSAPPFGPSQSITINFPVGSNYTISECRFRSLQPGVAGPQRPATYTWETSSNGGPFLPQATVFGNLQAERYDFFPAVADVTAVRLTVSAVTSGNMVRIDEIEIPWIRIRSRCRINSRIVSSYAEKYIRSCVLTNSRTAPATITKITPSVLPGTNMTSIWDEVSFSTYTAAGAF